MSAHLPYLEHCPRCVPPVDCPPLSIREQGDGIRAQYRCHRCLYSWHTGWAREPATAHIQRPTEGDQT